MKCTLSRKLRVRFIFAKGTLGRVVHEFGQDIMINFT